MKSKGIYKNEVEKPEQPEEGRMERGMGMKDFKADADDQAYGQAGSAGCKSDERKISSQFKNYHWADGAGNSGY